MSNAQATPITRTAFWRFSNHTPPGHKSPAAAEDRGRWQERQF